MLRLVLRESKRAWGCLEPSSSSWFSLVRPSTASLLTSRKSLLFASRKGFSTNEHVVSTEEHINQPGAAGEDVAHKREAAEKREEKEGKEKKERKQTKGESREKEDNENEGERIELSPEEQERLKRERELEYYTRAISRAGRAERHSEVFKYCMEMKQAGIKPNMVIMNAVIDSFASTRRIDSAFLMLDQLLEMGLTPNLKTLDGLLKACDVHAESKRAIEVTEKMRNMNVWPDVYSHTCLTSIYAKTGEFERGWAEYEALKAVFSAIPTDILVNFFRQVLKHNNPEWTKTILEEMTTHDVNVSPPDYYRSLDIFLHGRHLGGSMIIYERFGDVLDEGTLVKLLELTARTKDRAFGARVFETIRRHTRGAPSKYAFNTLLYSAYASRDVVAFLDTVTAMVREGHKLGAAFVTMFARMCKTQEELDVAHNHLYKLGAEGNATVDVMDAVMHACAHSGDMQRALAVFSDCMQKFQLQPDIGSFNALIEACEKAKDLNSALGVMQQLSTSGVTPTNDTFRTLINTCVAVRDLERATVALSDMVQQGLQPTYQIYASLATLCAQVGEREQAGAILDAMRSSGMSPDDFLISEVQPIRKGRQAAPTSANPTWAPNPKFRDQHT